MFIRWCGSLKRNGPHRLTHLNAWSLVGRTVLGRIRCDLSGRGVLLGLEFEV